MSKAEIHLDFEQLNNRKNIVCEISGALPDLLLMIEYFIQTFPKGYSKNMNLTTAEQQDAIEMTVAYATLRGFSNFKWIKKTPCLDEALNIAATELEYLLKVPEDTQFNKEEMN